MHHMQSFIISILKHCVVTAGHKVKRSLYIFSLAVIINCFDVICFLLERCCDSTDVNATDDSMRTSNLGTYKYKWHNIQYKMVQMHVYGVDKHDC